MGLTEMVATAAVAVAITVAAAGPVTDTYGWAVGALDDIRAAETIRQQTIQDVACEAQGLGSGCPVVVLARTVITAPPP